MGPGVGVRQERALAGPRAVQTAGVLRAAKGLNGDRDHTCSSVGRRVLAGRGTTVPDVRAVPQRQVQEPVQEIAIVDSTRDMMIDGALHSMAIHETGRDGRMVENDRPEILC